MYYSTPLLRQLRMTVGRNMHQRRRLKKITLRRLAQTTGIAEPMLDHYELGKNEITLAAMLSIACALGTTVQELLKD